MPRFDIAALTDIPEGEPFKAMAGETAVLLIRRGGTVTALAHACPHLGLPLSKGVVRGDTIICAFHHACFDARSGKQTRPPGHGDLRRYDVTLEDGRVHVEVEPDAAPHPAPAHARQALDPRRFVIAGAGAAAEACALALREEGFEGVIEMIAPGAVPPYDRTMLSKGVLSGDKALDTLALSGPDALAARDVALVDGRVAGVEPGRVTLAGGGQHAFDALLVAPGGIARRPDLPGANLPGVHTLRSAEDAAAIGATARKGGRAVLMRRRVHRARRSAVADEARPLGDGGAARGGPARARTGARRWAGRSWRNSKGRACNSSHRPRSRKSPAPTARPAWCWRRARTSTRTSWCSPWACARPRTTCRACRPATTAA